MTDMREALKRLFKQHHLGSCYPDAMEHEQDEFADAALSLIQPEIDRRVAEERAKLLERLREPSEGMWDAGEQAWMCCDLNDPDTYPVRDCFRAMLAQFEKENSDG